jgi:RNA polymerase sigma factor (sigma-70 family)
MAAPTRGLLTHLRSLALPAAEQCHSDAALLERFVHRQDQGAFATLVNRYGRLVEGVCGHIVGDFHTCQDACQATWMVLARKAPSLRRADRLAAWLHGTAYRLSLRCRRAGARRRRHESCSIRQARQRSSTDPLDELTARELLTSLHMEVERLPQALRLPLVLCCLEGLSQEEAASRLGWTPGSVKGRLERGRKRLHDRLARRGLALTAMLGAAQVCQGVSAAPARTVIVEAALRFGAGQALPADAVSASANCLAKGALRTMTLKKIFLAATLLLGAGAAVSSGALAFHSSGAGQSVTPEDETKGTPPAAKAPAGPVRKLPAGGEAPFVWGDAHNGLRLGIGPEAPGPGGPRLAVALENVGKEDLVLNLGMMLANGRKQFPAALRVTLTDARGATWQLRRMPGFVAGRVDPFVVPLAVGGRYTLRFDLADLVQEGAKGSFKATVAFVGKAVARGETNNDATGLALMPYWTGTIHSGTVPVELAATPVQAKLKFDAVIWAPAKAPQIGLLYVVLTVPHQKRDTLDELVVRYAAAAIREAEELMATDRRLLPFLVDEPKNKKEPPYKNVPFNVVFFIRATPQARGGAVSGFSLEQLCQIRDAPRDRALRLASVHVWSPGQLPQEK